MAYLYKGSLKRNDLTGYYVRLEKLCKRYGWTPSQAMEENDNILNIFEKIAEIEEEKLKRDQDRLNNK